MEDSLSAQSAEQCLMHFATFFKRRKFPNGEQNLKNLSRENMSRRVFTQKMCSQCTCMSELERIMHAFFIKLFHWKISSSVCLI